MKWRVIFTDSKRSTGVAPECEWQDMHPQPAPRVDHYVYDCCPGPHIETWSERTAAIVAQSLTDAEAELCS